MFVRWCSIRGRRPFTSRFRPQLDALEERSLLSISFAPPIDTVSGGPYAGRIAAGDFDKDGMMDLAVENFTDSIPGSFDSRPNDRNATIGILRGNGDGSYRRLQEATYRLGPLGKLLLGDFNHDAWLDIYIESGSSSTVILANGSGNFAFPGVYPAQGLRPSYQVGGVLGDFDDDGTLDAVSKDVFELSLMFLWKGKGDGTFASSSRIETLKNNRPTTCYPQLVRSLYTPGDINGDSHLDLIASSGATQPVPPCDKGRVSFVLGKGDGTFPTASAIEFQGHPAGIALGDFNGDEKLDVAVGFWELFGNQGKVQLYLQDPLDFSFALASTVDLGSRAHSLAMADFDRDGRDELLVVTTSALKVFQSDGGTSFEQATEIGLATAPAVFNFGFNGAVADMDNDGWPDLVVRNGTAANVSVLLNQSGTPNQRFVTDLYLNLLGRPAEDEGLFYWSGLLDQGATRSQVTQAIQDTLEYRTKFVHELYDTLLKRAVDPQGLSFFVSMLQNGSTFDEVTTAIVASDEYFRASPPHQRFVAQVYRNLLERPADHGGLLYWSNLLDQGFTRAQIVQAIEQTPEYRTKFVHGLYGSLLKRNADPLGLSFFASILQQGGTIDQVRSGIFASDEYFRTRSGGSAGGFLSALANDALGHDLDRQNNTLWRLLLDHGYARGAVVASVMDDPDAKQLLVHSLYRRHLHRDADRLGLDTFTGVLRLGWREEDVLANIVGSEEYFAGM